MSILRALSVVFSTVFHWLISFVVSFSDPGGEKQNDAARRWAVSLLRISGVHVTVHGLERIQPGRSYVIAANHLSYMDTPVVLANIPVQFRFLAKSGLFRIPFLGTHLSRAGHIAVPREDPRAAVKTMTLAAELIREKGISVLIFPEGGRSQDGELRPFKDGAAYIAIKAGVPVVPIALLGTREILPFGSGTLRPGPVVLRIGEPLETASLTLRDRGALTAHLREEIALMLRAVGPSDKSPDHLADGKIGV